MNKVDLKYFKIWKILGAKGLILILLASVWPQYGDPPEVEHLDKVLHFLVYLIASFYFHQVFDNKKGLKTTIYLFIYSAFIEVLQGLTKTRSAEYLDLVANLTGILVGQLLSTKASVLKKIDKILS